MLKYVDTKIVFQEVPDEIALAINISNCPCNCDECHSSYLAGDVGNILDFTSLHNLICDNKGITCVCFMGGDKSPWHIHALAVYVKATFPKLKVAWYSGREKLHFSIECNIRDFDYIKLGPYKKDLGPLNCKTTNQRFYKVIDGKLVDITNKFWK